MTSTSTPPADMECVCCDCGTPYQLSGGEQQFYLDKGLKLPRRCKPCRDKRKAQRQADAPPPPPPPEDPLDNF